ncbi:MAG: hypothetical protein QOI66_2545 [Myxococcales bacterium]|jgi:hypothetical protein|nr:hypothetical protein [Myxococcales bacterium]
MKWFTDRRRERAGKLRVVRNGVLQGARHLVDSEVGLGRQFTAADLNGDGKVDIAVASKHGAFLFFQQ